MKVKKQLLSYVPPKNSNIIISAHNSVIFNDIFDEREKDIIYILEESGFYVIKNINNLKKGRKKIIGFGAPAKATTALNFFGVTKEIDFIVEDNKLKHDKFVPGVNIQIKDKSKIKDKNNTIVVLAWNFFNDIKKNNTDLSKNFINIKDLE